MDEIMNQQQMKQLVEREVASSEPINNWHGISRQNLADHLVEPYLVEVYSDEDGSDRCEMWVVLHEHVAEPHGFLLAYCPASSQWCLVERSGSGRNVCDVESDATLIDALNNM